jgi:hypothetical protein
MERMVLLENLEMAKWHAAQDQDHIARQKKTIAYLRALGADTAVAEEILKTYEQSQYCHLMDMQRNLNDLHAIQ